MQASEKYMARRSSVKFLSFYIHTGLGHNFNSAHVLHGRVRYGEAEGLA